MNSSEDLFIDLILNNLEKSGFPHKKVSFPLEKLYEAADNKGINFNQVLIRLMDEKNISHEKKLDKIIFFATLKSAMNGFDDLDIESMKKMDKGQLMNKIQEMMSNLSPEQREEIQRMYSQMSPQEREEIMKKGRDMGLV